MSRRIAFRALPALVSAAVVFAAGSSMASASVKAHAAATTSISVKATEYHFALSATSLKKPGTVTFKIKNAGHVPHDFKIDNKTSKMISPGKSTTLTVKFAKKGSFYYECTVPGHAALGMKGYFKVK
ncbi:MAG TPA: cupredoxin domain-containing protein [Solirubrobacteraceae bacterium]|jgi:uncharacterized cupredoxin-like copper-binding protein|nr:cupredoxin domain-containing protein [Solirubrobacteraceae bacterium]